ncbi:MULTISPECIES: hypothetical protein [Chelativorans]|uniref:Peptidase M50 n=1 Tax=Chelativorans sp. (strain BNC1) TaxID=266779 RepID=Q11EB1_CHESB|nr:MULTISPECIES: hypothetical protein [Chelativorans]
MSLLRDLTIGALVSRLIAMLLLAALLGGLMALLAWLSGDRRPQFEGRLTLNPFAHLAVGGTLVAAVFGMGWIRPMRFNTATNRLGAVGTMLTPVAALILVALTIPLVDSLRSLAVSVLPRTTGYAVIYALSQYQQIALGSCLLNLVPIPGLACGAIWTVLWPNRERRIALFEPVALGVLAAGIVAGLISSPARLLMPYLSGLA